MKTVLYEVPPDDPATLLSATVVLSAVAFIATYLPARRAASVEPTVALRQE
jgi:ABC-type lipoprotein release transport system permease subunit